MNGTAPSPRVDSKAIWEAERDRIGIIPVASELLGPAIGKQGRLLRWRCFAHDDSNPSLVVDPVKLRWRCYPCGIGGDAVELVKRRLGLNFPEAVAYLIGRPAPLEAWTPRPSPPTWPTPKPLVGPQGMPLQAAKTLVAEAEARLWSLEGRGALAYLTGQRRLTLGTIKAAGLGWTPRAEGVAWTPPGIVIPWREGDRLARVKVRPDDNWRLSFSEDCRPPKYLQAFADRAVIYPGRNTIRAGRPLVIVEGELDALLLGQEIEGMASVMTLGGTGDTKPEPAALGAMLFAPRLFIATDADKAGEKAAALWSWTGGVRVKPHEGKDWTDAARAGVNLRLQWSDFLGVPWTPYSWDHLAGLLWGPAATEFDPGIVIDRPDPVRRQLAWEALGTGSGDAYEA